MLKSGTTNKERNIMSVDIKKMDQQMEKIKQKEERIRKEKAAILKKKKDAKQFVLMKIGEIFFEKFKVGQESDKTASMSALLTYINESKLNDKEKRKMSDLITGKVLNIQKSVDKDEIKKHDTH